MRIYLDMCCYNRPYDDQSQLKVAMETQSKIYIQNRIRNGDIELVGSYILDFEVSRNPFEMRRKSIINFIYENIRYYVGEERSAGIAPIATKIMDSGIKEKDAYHLAAAIYTKCDYFITTDVRLLKFKSKVIKLTNPIEFAIEMEEER